METRTRGTRRRAWIAMTLCAAVFVAGLVQLLFPHGTAGPDDTGPGWLPLLAAGVAAAAVILSLTGRPSWPRLRRGLGWGGLLLMLWTASGLPLDLFRVVSLIFPGLMPAGVDWAGLATRVLALAALVALARTAPPLPRNSSASPARWYGYAALALALPYPVLKTWWAFGGSLGLLWPGADGLAGSFALWLPAVPWLLAACLSLLLVIRPHWTPRRLLLIAGWSATVIVATIGPVACWSLLSDVISGDAEFGAMHGWVFGLFYGSWMLWAIAAAAATRSYQLAGEPRR